MAKNFSIHPHTALAMGENPFSGDEKFGVKPMSAFMGRTNSSPTRPAPMSDAQRHAPIKHSGGRLPAQANPDHGDH